MRFYRIRNFVDILLLMNQLSNKDDYKSFEKSEGYLPEIHKAAIKVAFEYNDKYRKFQNPKIGLFKLQNFQLQWPSPELMDKYVLGSKPTKSQRQPEKLLKELGHHPYRAKQPNGWSDISIDWLSPELLIRRLVLQKKL